MSPPPPPPATGFDQYAAAYDAALDQGLTVSGEHKEYFARSRVAWLRGRLAKLAPAPRTVLDFGCGTGAAVPFFHEAWAPERVLGVDVSARSLEVARKEHGSERTRFCLPQEWAGRAAADLAFCNGVFHHIPLAEREAAVRFVFHALRPGGWFAFWENNPWNPGTRYIMRRIPFDRDAITLTPPEARALLARGGFTILGTDFLFIFPRLLGWLRFLEPPLARWPLGAQYLVLARRPEAAVADGRP